MPVSFIVDPDGTGAVENFLTPAPFVSINKTFQKQGDGEIIGSTYAITLTGHIVADRGSPQGDGKFLISAADVIVAGLGADDWYEEIQHKQKALSNLCSKVNEGAYLHVQGVQVAGQGAVEGFKCYIKLESIDLPTHNPGDPYKCEYTINLTSDHLIGPAGIAKDEDDWEESNNWLISAASETYEIAEDQRVYQRHLLPTGANTRTGPATFNPAVPPPANPDKGALFKQNKTYILTRVTSATGKNKFVRDDKGDGLNALNKFSQVYAENGKAWQQARGFLYTNRTTATGLGIINHTSGFGNRFFFGLNDKESDALAARASIADNLPPGQVTGSDDDVDDIHKFAMNLPVPDNTTDPLDRYKAFNYKRVQSADIRGGSFTVTETWTLAPQFSKATESVDFSITEDTEGDGTVTININGSITGILDNADDKDIGDPDNSDRPANRPENTQENFHYEGVDSTTNSKYQHALEHYRDIMPFIFNAATRIINDIPEYVGFVVNPVPKSKTVAQQPDTGTITYQLNYTTDKAGGNFIPYVKNEEFTVNDTYPGHVAAQQSVLGRRLGPIMQSIGTQTLWQRDLSITGNFEVSKEKICVTDKNQLTTIGLDGTCADPACTTEATCTGAKPPATNCASVWTFDDCVDAGNTVVFNPNYINIRESLQPVGLPVNDFTTDMTEAKPGGPDVGGAVPVHAFPPPRPKDETRLIQAKAIKQLIDSFDPRTYLVSGGLAGATQRVRKRFMNPPQESWNMKTGSWSYNVSWIYEVADPWAFPTTDYIDPNLVPPLPPQDDELDHPYPGQIL